MTRGFTLIEMVVVLLVLAVVVGTTVPALLSRQQPTPMAAAQRAIIQVLDGARYDAVRSGHGVSVSFDGETGRYWVLPEPPVDGGPTDEGSVPLRGGVHLETAGPRATIRFLPTGVAFGDSLVLTSDAGRSVVGVEPWIGVVRVR